MPRRATAAATLLALALAGCAAPALEAPQSPPVAAPAAASDPELAVMIEAAAAAAAAGPEVSRIWPGYWPPDQPFLLYAPGTGALLVSAGPAPAGFAPLPEAAVPPALRGRALFRPGALAGVQRPFELAYPLDAERSVILIGWRGDVERVLGTLFHEEFHNFQRTAFKSARHSQFVRPDAIPDRVAFAAAAEAERRILAAALEAGNEEERLRLLRLYLALRRERERGMPAEAVGSERDFERIEGTAEYAERATRVVLAGAAARPLPVLLAEGLRTDLAARGQAYLTTWFRSRGYGTGAALGWLLARFDPAGWQDKVAAGEPLDEQLARAIGFDALADPPALARQAKKEFGYEALVAELGPKIRAAAAAEIKSAGEFYALAPYRLVLEFAAPPPGAEPGPTLGFSTGTAGMTELAPSQLVLPRPEVVNLTAPGLSLTARGHPFMTARDGELSRYTVLLPAAPAVNGTAAPASGERRFDAVEVSAEGLELRTTRPARVTVAGSTLTVAID